MKKLQIITIVLLSSFAYGQNTGILDVNYAKVKKNNLAINQQIPEYNENSNNTESKKSFYVSGKINHYGLKIHSFKNKVKNEIFISYSNIIFPYSLFESSL